MSTLLTPEHYSEIKSRYPRFNEPWTEEEEDDLREQFYCDFTLDQMAGHLGRTPNSIKMKLKALGLYVPKPAPRPWSEDDDRELVELYCEGSSFEELAMIFGRSENAVISRLVRLRAGLRPSTARQE